MSTTTVKPPSPRTSSPLGSVGTKYWMAITGAMLIGFVLFHMLGNWQLFLGREALNRYAATLKSFGPILWAARLALLTVFVVHLILAIRLKLRNSAARPVAYAYQNTIQASYASRAMVLTGLTILAFVVFHLAHFTLGWTHPDQFQLEEKLKDGTTRHDVYGMVVMGFQNPVISGSYIVAMLLLGLHLWHGASSLFQSLGLNHPRYNRYLRCVGPVVASVVVLGNCSMPLAVLFGLAGGN